jgi:hypothetical protein
MKCCGTVRHNCIWVPSWAATVTLNSEWGDIHVKVGGNLTSAKSQQKAASVVNVGWLENLPLLGYIHCLAKKVGDRVTSEYSVL